MYGSVHNAEIDDGFAVQVAVAESFTAFDILVVVGSAGGISALISFVETLPPYFPIPIIVAQHLASRSVYTSVLDRVLQRHTRLHVKWAEESDSPLPGTVYLVPQDSVAGIDSQKRSISVRPKSDCLKGTLSGNWLFHSAANAFGTRALAVVLSGVLSDGAEGSVGITRSGGRLLAQAYASCDFADMPRAAMKRSGPALAFDPVGLSQAVMALVMVPGASDWFRVGRMRNLALSS